MRDDVRYVLIQGDTYLIYLHLEDPESIAATVNYTLLLPEPKYSMSQWELFLYDFADRLKSNLKTETLR